MIVFSHGSVNDPINSAHLLERIAAEGFVVAAPTHVTDSQEDVRVQFINSRVDDDFPCALGLPAPCARPNNTVNARMVERAVDITNVLDSLPDWFGTRADLSRIGMLGHSRGTLAGMAAAAGSAAWGVLPEPRVKAVMGMASGGMLAVTLQPNLADVDIPTLLVAGGRDRNSPLNINQALFNQIGCPVVDPLNPVDCAEPKAPKRFVVLPDAHHRSFISTFCDQTQAVGAIAKADPNAVFEVGALTGANGYQFLTNAAGGRAMDYCSLDTFTTPVDIRDLVHSIAGFCIVSEPAGPEPGCAESGTVPTSGLDEEAVKQQMTELAVEFFTANLHGATPPTLSVPADFATDATGPAGAPVTFTATATDDLDPDPTVECTPSSGSTFAIGATVVECVARDKGGNTSRASFTVTVRGAVEQIDALIGEVIDATRLSAAVKAYLIDTLHSLTSGLDPSDARQRRAACLLLKAFATIVRFVVPSAQAAEWTADANRIRAVLAC